MVALDEPITRHGRYIHGTLYTTQSYTKHSISYTYVIHTHLALYDKGYMLLPTVGI